MLCLNSAIKKKKKKKILYLGIDIIRYVLYFACFIFSSGSFKTTIAIYQIFLPQ